MHFAGFEAGNPTSAFGLKVVHARFFQNPEVGRARLLPSQLLSQDSAAPQERRPTWAEVLKEVHLVQLRHC